MKPERIKEIREKWAWLDPKDIIPELCDALEASNEERTMLDEALRDLTRDHRLMEEVFRYRGRRIAELEARIVDLSMALDEEKKP